MQAAVCTKRGLIMARQEHFNNPFVEVKITEVVFTVLEDPPATIKLCLTAN